MSGSAQDKRTLERRRVHWRASVVLPHEQSLAPHIVNASEEGLGMRCTTPLVVGSEIALLVAVVERQHPGKTLAVRLHGRGM